MEIWETKSGRRVLVFKAFNGETSTQIHKMLWWDNLDEELVLTTIEQQLKKKIGDVDFHSLVGDPQS